jgi:serine/threonine-protein kinase
MPAASFVHEFGSFRLDSAERLLLRAGQPVSMTPKAFDLLVYLVDHAGRLVTKQALMSALWPDSFVEEANLTFTVSALRRALGDGQDGEQFIQTVPTRGYRFVAPVTSVGQAASIGSALSVSHTGGGGLRSWALICAAALLTGAVIGGLTGWNLKPSPRSATRAVARLTVPLGADEEIDPAYPAISVSPNGAHLVYVARRGGVRQLYLRPMNGLASKVLVGTEDARAPFFSPDSQWIGFFAEGKLKKIPVTGGAPQILCDAGRMGGSWGPNDIIYLSGAGRDRSGLWQVSAKGGAPQPFTTLQPGEISHRWPQVLPGGDAVLFTSRTGPGFDERQVQLQRVSSGERRIIVHGDTGYYVSTGHLVYVQPETGALLALPFDVTRMEVGTAAPVTIADGILSGPEGAHYAFSGDGLLAYVGGLDNVDDRTPIWVDRSGKTEPLTAPGRPYEILRISPVDDQVALGTRGAKYDVLIYNFARGDITKVVSEGSNQFAIWTPDGKRLTYRATRAGTRNIFWRMADGSGLEEQLTTGKGTHTPGSWSPNGQVLLFTDSSLGRDILAYKRSDQKTERFLAMPSINEGVPQFSPDGNWVAYVSDESGREEIYVTAYPGPAQKVPISTDGGKEPVWNPNGRELFYRSGSKMMAVDIATQPAFARSRPRELFRGDYVPMAGPGSNYDVSRDGRRFLMIQRSARENATPTQIVVVLNWFEELKRLVPTK